MEILNGLFETLNNLSPLAVIALLGTIIFLLVKGKTAVDEKVETVTSNHLHDLPEIVDTMREMNSTLRRIEVRMAEEFTYLRAKLINGHKQ